MFSRIRAVNNTKRFSVLQSCKKAKTIRFSALHTPYHNKPLQSKVLLLNKSIMFYNSKFDKIKQIVFNFSQKMPGYYSPISKIKHVKPVENIIGGFLAMAFIYLFIICCYEFPIFTLTMLIIVATLYALDDSKK